MKNNMWRKGLVFAVIVLFIGASVAASPSINKIEPRPTRIVDTYTVVTPDRSSITLTRYYSTERPSIIFIHGMGCNHKIFDWDEEHSLARYLNDKGWDVWLLDLRTHDGDGDLFFAYLFGIESDREYINQYWDFDRTLLKIDVVTAVRFVLDATQSDKLVLSGHSYGGYLAYAYAEVIGQDNLSAIITTGASPYANPESVEKSRLEMLKHGFYLGNRAYVNPLNRLFKIPSLFRIFSLHYYSNHMQNPPKIVFYDNTTPEYIWRNIGYFGDVEPAGVWVDMFFGKDRRKYNGHWVDPQTLYDYSENLHKITVPFLAIAGDEDPQDPSGDIYRCYENVSSTYKEFYTFPRHSHLDLLLGDQCREVIFPKIDAFIQNVSTIYKS